MPISPNRTVAPLIGENNRFIGKEITMISVDWDVQANLKREAMEAIHNTILSRATILAAGAVYDTGTKQDFLLEGDYTSTINSFTSLDGTVTGTLAQVLTEDIINLGTVDTVDFTSGTVAVTLKTTFKYA
jgi:hypothetical protein